MVGSSVAENLKDLLAQIREVERRAGRQAGDVKLIAVSKTKSLALIDEAAQAGQLDFGENYMQEAVEKVAARSAYRWHFIGSLQSNKVKDVVGKFTLIHSVDREKLLHEISKAAVKAELEQDILLQIHLGDEASKHGFIATELEEVLEIAAQLPGLRVRGLMGLPPLVDDEGIARGYFAELRVLAERARREFMDATQALNFDHLSMGTTHDFGWAILEGATHVRIGTALFGARET